MLDLDIFKNLLIVLVSPSHHFITEVVVQRCSVKKVFLEISQNSQQNTSARASFLKPVLSSVRNLFIQHAKLFRIRNFTVLYFPVFHLIYITEDRTSSKKRWAPNKRLSSNKHRSSKCGAF